MYVLLLSIAAIASCCFNVVVLELLLKEDANMANTMTFCQFLFISLFLFATYSKFGSRPLAVPPVYHALMVAFFFISNVINNWAFKFNISLPLHMIFRSGALLANITLGVLLMGKRYSNYKYLSVIMVTIGVSIATIVSANMIQTEQKGAEDTRFSVWLFGILMLIFALISSSMLGLVQERFVTKFGKHPQEAMYMSHLLPLPSFILFIPELLANFSNFSRSQPINLYLFLFPKMWLLMLLNVVSSFLCILSIFSLTTEAPSLTVNLVISLRKFISLLFSVLYFQNPFTLYHWFSTFLVFTGTFIFAMVR